MMLEDGQRVISMLVADSEEWSVLTATENGYGKRTPIAEYTRHGRGTKGMIAIQTSERNGRVVAAVLAALGETNEEIMLISTGGVLIRTRVNDIRVMGRSTQGVTLINLDEGTYLAGLEKVVETEGGDDEVAETANHVESAAGESADRNNDSNNEINDPDRPEAED